MNVNLGETIAPNFSAKMNSPRNLSVEIVLLIIFSILFYWFLILPKQAALNTRKSNLGTLQDQESKMAGALNDLNNLVADLNSHRSDIATLDEALPLDNKLNNLQQEIQNIADSVNVSVGNIDVSGGSGGVVAGDKNLLSNPFGATRSLQTLSASVLVVGSFSQLEAFLQKIESSGRIMDVNSLDIDSGTNGSLSLKITLNAYYLAPY